MATKEALKTVYVKLADPSSVHYVIDVNLFVRGKGGFQTKLSKGVRAGLASQVIVEITASEFKDLEAGVTSETQANDNQAHDITMLKLKLDKLGVEYHRLAGYKRLKELYDEATKVLA